MSYRFIKTKLIEQQNKNALSDTKSKISSKETYEILSKATSEIRSQASNEISKYRMN